MKRLIFIFICGIGLTFQFCKGASPVMSLDEVIKSRGQPVLLASRFELARDERGNNKVTFFEVAKKVEDVHPFKDVSGVLVFTQDVRFARHVRYHFNDLQKADDHVASTMFGSAEAHGSTIEIFEIIAGNKLRTVFAGKIRVAFLESGVTPLKPKK